MMGVSGKIISRFLAILLLLALTACHQSQTTLPPTPKITPPLPVEGTPLVEEMLPPQGTILIPGDSTRTLVHDGLERSFVVHVPPGLDEVQPIPLVLAFHGLGLNASEMMRISGLSAQADASGFIVVYPNGTGQVQSWNAGHCCGEAVKNNVDDTGFVRAMVEDLAGEINIDPNRIFVTGFSNGAIFTYQVACELADLIAAVSPVSATPVLNDLEACNPERPVPLLHFHGTADEANAYYGSTNAIGFQFLPVSTTIEAWVKNNGCATVPETSTSGSITHDVYTDCTNGASVELYTIENGMHAWPGGEAVNEKMGEPTTEISASQLMWEFFLAHPKQ